jgi:serine/threonine-protein kinase
VPPNVAAAVQKALEKLPADRFETAAKFAEALKNSAFTLPTAMGGQFVTGGARWKQRAAVPLAVALVLALAAAAWLATRPSLSSPVTRLDLALGAPAVLQSSDVVISPDGSMLAFVGVVGAEQPTVYLRRLDGEPDFKKVPGTEGANASPTFSPDSKSIAFRRGQGDGVLMRLELSSGQVTPLLRLDATPGTYLHWGTGEHMVFSGGPAGLYRIAATGGTPEFLAKTAGAGRYSFLLPDGSGVLFSRDLGVSVLTFGTDSVTLLVPNAVYPIYIETGQLLYIDANGGLFAVPFDLTSHKVTGAAIAVQDRVAAALGQRGFSVSRNGTLVYHEGTQSLTSSSSVPNRLAIVDFKGTIEPLGLPAARRDAPRFAPNGQTIAFDVYARGGTGRDIHTVDVATATDTRLTFDGDNTEPTWSPDGKRLLFSRSVDSANADLFVKPSDNSSPEQRVLSRPRRQSVDAWLPGNTILFTSAGTTPARDLFTFSLTGDSTPKVYLNETWNEFDARISPDGSLAAFTSNEAGSNDIWIRDFPVPKGKWQVSSTGGQAARWSRDGKYVYFWKSTSVAGDSLFRVRVDRTPTVVVRAPEFVLSLAVAGTARNWDLHPDGTRFVVTVPDVTPTPAAGAATTASRYLVVQNWFTELKRLSAKSKP